MSDKFLTKNNLIRLSINVCQDTITNNLRYRYFSNITFILHFTNSNINNKTIIANTILVVTKLLLLKHRDIYLEHQPLCSKTRIAVVGEKTVMLNLPYVLMYIRGFAHQVVDARTDYKGDQEKYGGLT